MATINISGTAYSGASKTGTVADGTVITLTRNGVVVTTTTTTSGVYSFSTVTVAEADTLIVSMSDTIVSGSLTYTVATPPVDITGGQLFSLLTTGTAYCFNTKNGTWTKFDDFPTGLPVMLNYLGTDLHIEDELLYKIFDGYNDDGYPFTISVTTKRHTNPSTGIYKSIARVDLYLDGETGISYTLPKSQFILDSTTIADANTKIYPGGYAIRQQIFTKNNTCKNYSIKIQATVSASNTSAHRIEVITWYLNERMRIY